MDVQVISDSGQSLYSMCWFNARDAIIVADHETGLIIDANPAAEELTGYIRQELIGKHFTELHPADERFRHLAAFAESSAAHPELEGFHILRKDGAILPVSIKPSDPFMLNGRWTVFGIHRDIREMESAISRLATKRWALKAYASAALALGRATSSLSLMQEICEAITRDSPFVLAWVGFPDHGPEKLIKMAGQAGSAISYMDNLKVSWSEDCPFGLGPTGIAFRTNTIQVVDNSETNEPFRPWLENARQFGIHSSLTAPFQVTEDARGILAVYSLESHAFGPILTEAFTNLAYEIGLGLHSLQQKERLEAERTQREKAQAKLAIALKASVGAIASALEAGDPYTAGHQSRTAQIACTIAREMHYDEEFIEGLHMAATLHDIGKIAVSDEILTKPGRLTNEEYELVKRHTSIGYNILKGIPFEWPIADVVHQHHERLDGSGYPLGLKGDQIHPAAKILAVSDVVEAMASVRPYRHDLGIDSALDEIEKQAGTKLDPDVVRTCLSLFRDKGYTLPH